MLQRDLRSRLAISVMYVVVTAEVYITPLSRIYDNKWISLPHPEKVTTCHAVEPDTNDQYGITFHTLRTSYACS